MRPTKELILKSVTDGMIRGLTFFLVMNIYISAFAASAPLLISLCIAVAVATIHGLLFFVLLRKETKNKYILLFCLISAAISILCFAVLLILPWRLPLREVNAGDGLMIMLLSPLAVGLGAISRYAIALPILKKKQN